MKRLLLLTAIFLTACASGPRFEYELSQVYRPDGSYDAWKTTNVSNEFNRFVDSRAMGEKHNWSENVPFVRVVDDHYVGFNIGDGHTGTLTFSAASKTLTIENTSLLNQDFKINYWVELIV